MNTPVVRLFALVIVLFGVLVAFTSRWTVFEAEALRENPNNRRLLFQEQLIKRGVIRTAEGDVIAGNRSLPGERFERRYPAGELFSHPLGYTSLERGRIGLEEFYNDPLTGRRTDAIGALERLLGPQKIGDDLRTTLSARAQEVAYDGLADRPRRGRRARRRDGRRPRDGRHADLRPARSGRAPRRSTAPPRPGSRPARR